jgi:hypothetical protein
MRQTFRDLYRESKDAHHNLAPFWLAVIGDSLSEAVHQYFELAKRPDEIKAYLRSNASSKSLLWGVALMVPAAVFLLVAIVAEILGQGPLGVLYSSPLFQRNALVVIVVVLPVLAIAINGVALLNKIGNKHESLLSWRVVQKYFWTLAFLGLSLAWLAFIVGHDTVGCAVENLFLLQWHGFRACVASH